MIRPLLTLSLLLVSGSPLLANQDPGSPAAGSAAGLPVIVQQQQEREPGPADLDEAIEIALKQFGGEVAGAVTVERDGREVHEIRVLLDGGNVRTVRIDPETGRIIPPRR